MGRRCRCQWRADSIALGLAAEGMPLPFLASQWPHTLVLNVVQDRGDGHTIITIQGTLPPRVASGQISRSQDLMGGPGSTPLHNIFTDCHPHVKRNSLSGPSHLLARTPFAFGLADSRFR